MDTKPCTGCAEVKPPTEFSINRARPDGRATRCRSCRSVEMRAYYARRVGRKRIEVQPGEKFCPRCARVQPLEAFAQNAGRKDGKQVYCRECWHVYDAYRNLSPESKAKTVARQVEYHRRDPIKHRARLYVSLAVFFGDLKKLPCEVCGATKVQAHHENYAKEPLKVRWLCVKHHNGVELAKRWR